MYNDSGYSHFVNIRHIGVSLNTKTVWMYKTTDTEHSAGEPWYYTEPSTNIQTVCPKTRTYYTDHGLFVCKHHTNASSNSPLQSKTPADTMTSNKMKNITRSPVPTLYSRAFISILYTFTCYSAILNSYWHIVPLKYRLSFCCSTK